MDVRFGIPSFQSILGVGPKSPSGLVPMVHVFAHVDHDCIHSYFIPPQKYWIHACTWMSALFTSLIVLNRSFSYVTGKSLRWQHTFTWYSAKPNLFVEEGVIPYENFLYKLYRETLYKLYRNCIGWLYTDSIQTLYNLYTNSIQTLYKLYTISIQTLYKLYRVSIQFV